MSFRASVEAAATRTACRPATSRRAPPAARREGGAQVWSQTRAPARHADALHRSAFPPFGHRTTAVARRQVLPAPAAFVRAQALLGASARIRHSAQRTYAGTAHSAETPSQHSDDAEER